MRKSKTLLSLFLVVFLCSNFLTAQNEVSDREIIALLELRSKTKGQEWTSTWDLSVPMTEWHGVTIKEGKVVGLNLSNNNLQGKIPLTIGNLRNLEHLDLSGNKLTGRIPVELRKFDNLKSIDLSENQLTGKIPNTVDRLENLQHFDLASNQLEGELPKNIVELSKLNSLVVANNDLSGEIPEGMEKLTKLKELYIGNNGFSDLNNLKMLSEQQLVLTDVDVNAREFNVIDFSKQQEGLSKLKFEEDEN